ISTSSLIHSQKGSSNSFFTEKVEEAEAIEVEEKVEEAEAIEEVEEKVKAVE
ncbi:hypothetical protein M9458_039544, partial [Cirrhinus mrigala]